MVLFITTAVRTSETTKQECPNRDPILAFAGVTEETHKKTSGRTVSIQAEM
jgi:hypothetical protein